MAYIDRFFPSIDSTPNRTFPFIEATCPYAINDKDEAKSREMPLVEVFGYLELVIFGLTNQGTVYGWIWTNESAPL